MLSYIVLLIVSYLLLQHYLPILQDPIVDTTLWLQVLRYSVLGYGSMVISNLLWRQKFVPKLRLSAKNQAVLITGCDTGFGSLLARRLDKDGFKVFACCLFPDKQGAKELAADCSSNLEIIKLDVTSDEDTDAAYAKVERELAKTNHQLLAVVNNAGILATGEVEFGRTVEPFERQLCKTSPRLVNVNSLAARISLPGLIGYCVSKSASLSFTDGIRIELMKWNIKVVSIEPHLFRTNLIAIESQHKGLRDIWESSRQATRRDYGEQFFEGAKRLLDEGIGSARGNIPDVVDAMYNSVTLRYPELHKQIFSSELERLRCWLLINVLPSYLQTFLLHMGTVWITGKPAALVDGSILSADKSASSRAN